MLFQAFLGGLSCKLYDDLNDNIVLKKFYNTTFMEYLKGIHYISLVSVSIDDPLFFIIFYIGCFLNHLRDGDAFKEPYEHSLLYSFILLFIILDYTKITKKYFDLVSRLITFQNAPRLTFWTRMLRDVPNTRELKKNSSASCRNCFRRLNCANTCGSISHLVSLA